jgi:hypothetical protein
MHVDVEKLNAQDVMVRHGKLFRVLQNQDCLVLAGYLEAKQRHLMERKEFENGELKAEVKLKSSFDK